MIKIQNVNGSSRFENPVGYNTWLEYWEAKTGKSAWRCSAIDCHKFGRVNLVGAHVKKVGSYDNSWYIVPLCHKCNMQCGQRFYVEGPLVPVDSTNQIRW